MALLHSGLVLIHKAKKETPDSHKTKRRKLIKKIALDTCSPKATIERYYKYMKQGILWNSNNKLPKGINNKEICQLYGSLIMKKKCTIKK